MTGPEEKVPPKRISTTRVAIALLFSVLLAAGSLAYHDGAFDTADLADAQDPGLYRFKGAITTVDVAGERFELKDGTGTRSFHWNVTTPKAGRTYVVEAEIDGDGARALAVSPVYLFKASWP